MLKKPKWRIVSEPASLLSILCLGFVFSFLLGASCNNGGNKDAAHDTTTASTLASGHGPGARVNWLQDVPRNRWDVLQFKSHPHNDAEIANEKRFILSYLWDSLSAYNASIKAMNPDTVQYVIDSIIFEPRSPSPVKFAIRAFLTPEVRFVEGGGTHLIPNEPPPPQ